MLREKRVSLCREALRPYCGLWEVLEKPEASLPGNMLPLLQNMKLVENIEKLADKKGCTWEKLAPSWVHHHGDASFPWSSQRRPRL